MVTATVGVRLLRALRARALATQERIDWSTPRPERRHITGSVVFGVGWAIAAACPGPIAAQLGQGVAWSLATLAGVVVGIKLYFARSARRAADALPESPATAR